MGRLDPLGQRSQRRRPQEVVKSFHVGVDGQNPDAIGAQETSKHRHGQVGRRRVAGRRINQGHAHGLRPGDYADFAPVARPVIA
jgi:hypothetical protein